MIYADQARALGAAGVAEGLGVIFVACATIVATFWFSDLISRLLGKIGMVIVVRVLGLILCAMAIQFMLTGLASSTINLVRRDTAAPYQHPHKAAPPTGLAAPRP